MGVSTYLLELLRKGDAIVMLLDTFVDLQKRLESLLCASAASVILHEVGRECGAKTVSRLRERTGAVGAELLKAFAESQKEQKWGEIDFSGFDHESGRGTIIVKDSFEAKKYGPAATSVCHFLRGYILGVISIFKPDLCLEENLCLARGDPHCEFRVRTLTG